MAKKPSTAVKRVATPVRMKIVWEACSAAGAVLGTFAYPDKVAAEAKVAMLTRSTGRTPDPAQVIGTLVSRSTCVRRNSRFRASFAGGG